MKKVFALIALLALIAMLTGCASIEQAMHPGKVKTPGGNWVDQSQIDKYNFKGIEAENNGDTYCSKCKKVNPGRVRICSYCGQYI